jgi:hypothetical protein
MIRSRSRMIRLAAIVAIFFILCGVFTPAQSFLEIARSFMLCIFIGLAAAYYPLVTDAMKHPGQMDEPDMASVGWFIIAYSNALWAFWYLVWKRFGGPDLWWDEYLLAGFAYMNSLGGLIILLIRPDIRQAYAPAKEWLSFGMKLTISLCIILTLLFGLSQVLEIRTATWPLVNPLIPIK